MISEGFVFFLFLSCDDVPQSCRRRVVKLILHWFHNRSEAREPQPCSDGRDKWLRRGTR